MKGKFIEGNYSLTKIKYYYIDSLGKTEIPIAFGDYSKLDSAKIFVHLKYAQIREGSQCDLISSLKSFAYHFKQQETLCDSLLSIRP